MRYLALILLLFSLSITGLAQADNMPLPAAQAFVLKVHALNAHTLQANWQITPGYYLYRDRISITAVKPAISLNAIQYPTGKTVQDNIFGTYQIYEQPLTVLIPLPTLNSPQVTVAISYQGCAHSGFCYPPVNQQITVALPTTKSPDLVNYTATTQHSFWHILLVLLSFTGLGILLAFTPCILPMLPILSGIILGQKRLSTVKAFLLALTYVLSMAIAYAMAGLLAALSGVHLQAILQNPWVIGLFSALFIGLALSLFNVYELRLPSRLQQRITDLSNRQQGGTYLGVAIMGILSILIVSPCSSAPLVAALAYITQEGNIGLGGAALFALGLGMGIPLLLIVTFGARLLPKSGPWMNIIKAVFGVLLLAVAIDMLARLLPGHIILLLWAILIMIGAVYLGTFEAAFNHWQKFWKGTGLVLFSYGILLLIGSAMGNDSLLQPLSFNHAIINTPITPAQKSLPLQRVKTITDVQQAITNANQHGKKVMLDFYADWCIACQVIERYTFSDPQVQNALGNWVLLQADITANDQQDQALLAHYQIIAPPAILFFDQQGREIRSNRVSGEISAAEFLKRIPQ